MIPRILTKTLADRLRSKSKAQIILGPRQAGKTTLVRNILEKKNDVLMVSGDDADVRQILSSNRLTELKRLIAKNKILFIDEAQRIPDIGISMKLIIDNLSDVHLIATGSSAFELSNKLNEPLTGRKFEYLLMPISIEELVDYTGYVNAKSTLNERLIYGMYPEVITHHGMEIENLKNICESYLYKDLFALNEVRKPQLFEKLLKALALQIGSEVSSREIALLIGSDPATVDKYIDMLEKSFVIFRLNSFARNQRNELKKARKIFFVDNGIRNALIGNFQAVSSRTDTGALWENFVISERYKYYHNHLMYGSRYFWRTQQQQEIDYLEEMDGKLCAWEIKWNSKRQVKFPAAFLKSYPEAQTGIINPDTVWDFLLKDN